MCTFFKQDCSAEPECASCLTLMAAGKGIEAAQQCSATRASGFLMDRIASSCISSNAAACGFSQQRCADNNNCSACYNYKHHSYTINNNIDNIGNCNSQGF